MKREMTNRLIGTFCWMVIYVYQLILRRSHTLIRFQETLFEKTLQKQFFHDAGWLYPRELEVESLGAIGQTIMIDAEAM